MATLDPTQAFYSAAATRAFDQALIQKGHEPGLALMKKAAMQAFATLKKQWPAPQQLLVVCGSGNNAGDGLFLAQYAYLAGYEGSVTFLMPPQSLKGEARQALDEWLQLGMSTAPFDPQHLSEATVVVDAILGTGLSRPITEPLASQFAAINQSGCPVLALDLPSGLDADTGTVLGTAIRADHTVTFITQKLGAVQNQGPDHVGQHHLGDCHLPEHAWASLASPPLAYAHGLAHWLSVLPQSMLNTHKGQRGTAVLAGGNHAMAGALQLAASSCLFSGCGLVKLITHTHHHAALSAQQPEWMLFDPQALTPLSAQAQVLAIGPGLGQDDWAHALMQKALQKALQIPQPLVIDADGLNWLAKHPLPEQTSPTGNTRPWILTPHPGEAARLLQTDTATIQKDRLAAVKELHQRYGGIIVLKGNGTLIYDGQHCEVCLAGNPGMATGGMGDVLTGLIAGLVAQKGPSHQALFEMACLGVWLHASAADRLCQQQGVRGVRPSAIAPLLPAIMAQKHESATHL